MVTDPPLCIYVDVDGTLVCTAATGERIPNPNLIRRIREWQTNGARLYCWSSHGAGYAQQVARDLRVGDCFVAFLNKPHAVVDDQSIRSWPYFLEVAPGRAEVLSLAQIREELERL